MKCRRIKFEKDVSGNILRRDIVWFGSYGKNLDGTAKFYSSLNKNDNYAIEAQGVSDALTQKLNVLQNELWFAINYGMPIWDKHKTTAVLDNYISSVILLHQDVSQIIGFISDVVKDEVHQSSTYTAEIKILTRYGEINFSVSRPF